MKVELNKQLDKEVYLGFRGAIVGGVNFDEEILKDHPLITEKNYNDYIDNFYQEHQKELLAVRDDTEKCFADIKDPLFAELQKYFHRDFSKNSYICCISIFDCNPRFLEKKLFRFITKDHTFCARK